MFLEQDFRIKSCLQIISPDPAHVFGNDTADLSGLDIRNKLFPTGPLKICPAPSVIRIMDNIGKSMLDSIAFEHSLLIYDRVAVPDLLVVTGQSLIQRRDFL